MILATQKVEGSRETSQRLWKIKSNPQLQCVRTIWSPLLSPPTALILSPSPPPPPLPSPTFSRFHSPFPSSSRFFLCIWIDVPLMLPGSLSLSLFDSVSSATLLSGQQRRWYISRVCFIYTGREKKYLIFCFWVFVTIQGTRRKIWFLFIFIEMRWLISSKYTVLNCSSVWLNNWFD